MSARTQRRVARKRWWCGCGREISIGDAHLEHTQFPGDDPGDYADAAGHPIRLRECAVCAARYGRGHLVEPIPEDQRYPYWEADGLPSWPDPLIDGEAVRCP